MFLCFLRRYFSEKQYPMKAALYTAYGSPDVLTIGELPVPEPATGDILVRVHASTVNSADVRLRKADPFAVRFVYGLTAPRRKVLGVIFSGTVERVGPGVSRFKTGDAIFGSCEAKMGAHAEFLCISETAGIALKPENLSFEDAASLPFGAATALHFLKKAGVAAGQKVQIYGASGSVGTAAVQVAHHLGAEVTAVCSSVNAPLVLSLGAARVLDYTKPEFMADQTRYDVIFETVNKTSIVQCMNKLKPGGTLILGAALLTKMISGLLQSLVSTKKVLFGVALPSQSGIEHIASLACEGAIKPVIDRVFSLEEIVAAHTYVEAGHKKGNVVIRI
jgi:NADPH:quinone reductase-like Zn-dependent oxidoreductase